MIKIKHEFFYQRFFSFVANKLTKIGYKQNKKCYPIKNTLGIHFYKYKKEQILLNLLKIELKGNVEVFMFKG